MFTVFTNGRMFIMNSEKKPKDIHTIISYDLWMKAQMRNISWNRALEVGINILTGNNEDTEYVKQKIEECSASKQYYEDRLRKIKDMKAKKQEITDVAKKHIELLKKSTLIVKNDIKCLDGRTKLWNNTTGLNLTPEEFYKLCQSVGSGEI
jgi:hypothetical protein